MASRKEHVEVGTPLGAVTAFALALNAGQTVSKALVEAIGGIGGGYLGARMPDILEPGISSHHRKAAHSVLAGFDLATITAATLPQWQARFRREADRLDLQATTALDGLEALGLRGKAASLRMLAGALPAFAAGYVSHLAMDAATPRSIRLV